jgi:hypothetical protein
MKQTRSEKKMRIFFEKQGSKNYLSFFPGEFLTCVIRAFKSLVKEPLKISSKMRLFSWFSKNLLVSL